MGYLVRDCVICGTHKVQMTATGGCRVDINYTDVMVQCNHCLQGLIYRGMFSENPIGFNGELDRVRHFDASPIMYVPDIPVLSELIPTRVTDLVAQAAKSRKLGMNDASGSMFRKSIDVATKLIYATDVRLEGKEPANAARVRIQALGALKILEEDIVDLADVALLDGNDAVHDVDPYTAEEAEALEDLTLDLLDRMFVRPAKIAAVRAKQIAAGVRKPD